VSTDTPAKPTTAAQPADAKPEAAAPAKPKRPAARKRAAAPKRAAAKRAASAKRAATTKRATDGHAAAPKAAAIPGTARAAPKPDRNRAAVLSVLDAQERTANAFAEYQTRAAALSRIPGATTLATAQANLLRRVTVTYVTAARDLLK
jgi:hypothetical protein